MEMNSMITVSASRDGAKRTLYGVNSIARSPQVDLFVQGISDHILTDITKKCISMSYEMEIADMLSLGAQVREGSLRFHNLTEEGQRRGVFAARIHGDDHKLQWEIYFYSGKVFVSNPEGHTVDSFSPERTQ